VSKKQVAEQLTLDGKQSYQCVLLADDQWHLTQEQATPPTISAGAAWTLCGPWAEFKRGFERRRPTCASCIAAVVVHEARSASRKPAG
jgi:hypothetical protein